MHGGRHHPISPLLCPEYAYLVRVTHNRLKLSTNQESCVFNDPRKLTHLNTRSPETTIESDKQQKTTNRTR